MDLKTILFVGLILTVVSIIFNIFVFFFEKYYKKKMEKLAKK